MTERFRIFGLLTLIAMFLFSGGCSRKPSRVFAPSIDAAAAGAAAMAEYDTNKDGKVAGEELQKAPSLNAAIDNLDLNKDRAVSAEEVTKRIEEWQKSKVGLTNASVRVTYRGQPLGGATVVFEPEKFLGASVKMATGTTDPSGAASVSIANAEYPGVAAGLYKVKITKGGMNLAAKYNDQTILGTEVASDAKDAVDGGLKFDLN
jgi:hypothetical protein